MIEIAKEMGNITFIYHSVMHSLLSEMPHHDRKRKVEKMLVDSGIPYVIVQPTVFMQMLTPAIQSVKNGGPFVQKFYTSGQTKMSYVDMKDYAEAAAEIIVAGTYTYGTYEFCSDGAYSLADMENIFSELTMRKVEGAYISDADFLATAHKDPDSYAGQTLLTMFRHYNENSFCGNAFTLTQILGRHPVIIRKLLQQLKAAGLIEVQRGTGGVVITKPLNEITFLDIYRAVECTPDEELLHFRENPNHKCPVGRNIHHVLDDKLARVQEAMERELAAITLADVKKDTELWIV